MNNNTNVMRNNNNTNIMKNNNNIILKNTCYLSKINLNNKQYIKTTSKITHIIKIMNIFKKLKKYQLQQLHSLFCSNKKYNIYIKLSDMIIEKELHEIYLLKIKNILYSFDNNILKDILFELY